MRMNLKLLVVIFFLIILNIQAQQTHYQFSHNAADYVPLGSGATVLNTLAWFEEEDEFEIPLAFPIYMFDDELEYLVLSGGNLRAASKNNDHQYYLFTPHATDLLDAGFQINDDEEEDDEILTQSPLKYQVVGAAGERILKIEVNNAASVNEASISETNLMRINYQIWFYEQNKSIEVRYGSNTITNFDLFFGQADDESPEESAGSFFTSGLAQYVWDDDGFEFLKAELLEGLESNPVLIEDLEFETSGLRSYPALGRVYRFGGTLGVANFTELESKIQLYPNPTVGMLTIASDREITQKTTYIVYNLLGQRVQTGELNATKVIDVSALKAGVYQLKIDGFKNMRFMKK